MAFNLPEIPHFDEDDLIDAMNEIWEISQTNTPLGYYMAEKFHSINQMYMMLKFASQDYFFVRWSCIFKWAKYVAVDKDLEVYAYEQHPHLNDNGETWTTPTNEHCGEKGDRIEFVGKIPDSWLPNNGFDYTKALYVRP